MMPMSRAGETRVVYAVGVFSGGKYPEYLSRIVLSYAVGRKTQELSPTMRKLPFCVYVDERAFGASMTGLKLVDNFILQVDRYQHFGRNPGWEW